MKRQIGKRTINFSFRGRQALRWVVIGSLLLLIGDAGSKFVLEVLLGRR